MAAVWSWAGRFSGRPQSGTWARVTTRLSLGEPWAGAGARGRSRCSAATATGLSPPPSAPGPAGSDLGRSAAGLRPNGGRR